MKRHQWLVPALLFISVLAPAGPVAAQGGRADGSGRLDVLIVGGTVIDGTGRPGQRVDIGVRDDRIVFMGSAARTGVQATRRIDATGKIVAPGFIDPHAHSLEDLSHEDAERRRNVGYLMQGVTTVITGNDGGGPVEVGARLSQWEQRGIGTNAALFVGFGSVRSRLLRMSDGAPSAEELTSMQGLVRAAMQDGAIGMSAGLYYAPQSYATTEEVIALARELAPFGGVYDTHLRDESSYTIGLLGAVREAIRIGEEARVAVNISHIKALGVDVWGRSDSVIAVIQAARRAGRKVTADQYPYTASGSGVGASLLPRWAEVGGRDSLRARLSNKATRERIIAEMTDNLRRRGGPESILITTRDERRLNGKRLHEIAQARSVPPIEAAIEIILSGDASIASFNMNERDITNFMRQEFVMTGSDGSGGHPRKYGTYPKKLRTYVLQQRVLSLEDFVQRSSAMVAETFGLAGRGVLRAGAFADIIVLDTATVADRATYETPTLLATGVETVLVNGQVAIDRGAPTVVLAGRALRRGKP